MDKKCLARAGRLSVWLEPRDVWVGAYIGPDAVYVCALPFLVRMSRLSA